MKITKIWMLALLMGIVAITFLLVTQFAFHSKNNIDNRLPSDSVTIPEPHRPIIKNTEAEAGLDKLLKIMKQGNIAFNTPESLNLHESVMIQLLLDVDKTSEALVQMLKTEGKKSTARIRISNRMEARLTGPGFTITAVTPETQAISHTEPTSWKWEIKPKEKGHQFLHLTLSALLSVEGSDTPRTIRTFDKTIEVNITWNQQISNFVKVNWKWLWTAILVPIIVLLWKSNKKPEK